MISPETRAVIRLGADYDVRPNLPYDTVSGVPLLLDAYVPLVASGPQPTLVYFHGGGWVGGTKEHNVLELLPYLAQGWTVFSVEYRCAPGALAPAAVVDCRCALRWVAAHAGEFKVDTQRIVLSGHSAGGHLALMVGLALPDPDLDGNCPWPVAPRVAAVVNWFGITDVPDLLEGPHLQDYAVTWVGGRTDRLALAGRLSPLSYACRDTPPVITVHGDEDGTVPYTHAVALHTALSRLGVPNELITLHGADHGGFSATDLLHAYGRIDGFLRRYVPKAPQ